MTMPTLATSRLVLRPFDISDGPTVERLAGAREVADTTLSLPHPYPAGGGGEWIATHAEAWEQREHLTLAICKAGRTGQLIGAIGLRISLKHLHGEIGYWIGADSWGNGYATEAARAIVAFGFGELSLHRIQGRHFTRNVASGRVMQKLGMHLEGVNRHAYRRWETFEDVAVYGLLSNEWTDSPAATT